MTNKNQTTLTPETLNSWALEGFKELRVSTRYRVYTYKYKNGQWLLGSRPIGIGTICRQANSTTTRWSLWA